MGSDVDQRVKTTRHLLRRGLISLLEQRPLTDISITELCRQSGINRGTFYAHYKDINDLHRCIEEEVFAQIQKTLTAHTDLSASIHESKEHHSIYYAVFDFLQHSSDFRSLLMNSHAYTPLLQKLLAVGYDIFVAEYRRIHSGPGEEQIRFAFHFIAAGILSLSKEWIAGGRKEPVEWMARKTEQMALACIKA